MPTTPKITVVQFPGRVTVVPDSAEKSQFDILPGDGSDLDYCRALLEKILTVPYDLMGDLFKYQCSLQDEPLNWLDGVEKLVSENAEQFESPENWGRMVKCYTLIERKRVKIGLMQQKEEGLHLKYVNAECEDRHFSFRETKAKAAAMLSHGEKILFLTAEKFDYEQATVDFLNRNLPDFSDLCQKEIDRVVKLHQLQEEFSAQNPPVEDALQFQKLKINCNINQLVDVFYRLSRELCVDNKPVIDGDTSDMVAMIVNSFVDKEGRALSPETVKTILTPSKSDKRPKAHRRLDFHNKC